MENEPQGANAVLEDDEQELTEEHDRLERLAKRPSSVNPDEKQSTLDWFLADEGGEDEIVPTYRIQIDVSTDPSREDYRDWVIKPVASERIDHLRRQFTLTAGNRAQRRRGGGAQELDAAKFNAQLVFEATSDPDLEGAFKQKQARGDFQYGFEMVIHRFRFKPLLVDQIAGQILEYSGGNDDAVRTATEIKAAGN